MPESSPTGRDPNPGISEHDLLESIAEYSSRFTEHGYSPKSLGWENGRQDIRFGVLLSFFEWRNASILDVGCGFGDLQGVLESLSGGSHDYTGIDVVPEFIAEARRRHDSDNARFIQGEFLTHRFRSRFDIVIGSGIFNRKFSATDNDAFVDQVMRRSFEICNIGFAFDFLSDRVDFQRAHTYHNSPERVLGQALNLSRRVGIRHDYMPFEFAVHVSRLQDFLTEYPVFER